MKIFLKFQPTKRQFYSPTLKQYFGRVQLGKLIKDGTITAIEYLGPPEEREAAVAYLMYEQPKTMHETMKESK